MVNSKTREDLEAGIDELELSFELTKQAQDEAKEADKTKDFFLALVSHELRSPLNAILGWTSILLNKEVDQETRRKALEIIERSAKAQAKIIEDLVDSARVTSRKLKLNLQPLNLFEVLYTSINSHVPEMEQKNLRWQFNHDTEEVKVRGDLVRLRQVFTNIIGNAVKFTPEGGQVIVNQKVAGKKVIIEFIDTGEGIAEEDLPSIFRLFAQGEENFTRDRGGLGLGLALSKSLIEKHDGTISVKSEGVGLGATFTIELRLAVEDESEKEKKRSRSENYLQLGVLSDCKILVVEDQDDSRNVLRIYLEQIGAEVECAVSVSDAFILLNKKDSRLPDVIVSDIGMPNEDGYSFLKKIRNSRRFFNIPAIALSAFTADENKQIAIESGFQKYHTKPFDPELLTEEILELLNTIPVASSR